MLLNEIAMHHQCHVLQPGTKLRNGYFTHQGERRSWLNAMSFKYKLKFVANILPGTGFNTQDDSTDQVP